jgi:hypothetical protein
LNGLDLDNNGIDDGLEIEALLPVSGEGDRLSCHIWMLVKEGVSFCFLILFSHFV